MLFLAMEGTLSSAWRGGSASLSGGDKSRAEMLGMRGPTVIHRIFGAGYGFRAGWCTAVGI